jgi:hypothetical protein
MAVTIEELQKEGWEVIRNAHVDGELYILLQKRVEEKTEFAEYSLETFELRVL